MQRFKTKCIKVLPLLPLIFAVSGCKLLSDLAGKKDSNPGQASNLAASPSPSATTNTAVNDDSTEPIGENLLSLSTGAFVVKASSANHTYSDFNEFGLIDGRVGMYGGQLSKEGDTSAEYVIALPEQTRLDTLEFWGHNAPGDSDDAKDVEVQMSDTSEDAGFDTILTATLERQTIAARQSFPVAKKVPGRWLKVILKNNYGGKYVSLSEIRGYGQRLTQTPIHDISGTYGTEQYFGTGDRSKIFLKQVGNAVEGCVNYTNPVNKEVSTEQLISNGAMVNNGLLLFTQQAVTNNIPEKGDPALFVFSPDHKRIYAQIDHSPSSRSATIGTKISDDIGQCPQWAAKTNSLADELARSGRVLLYGINFDTDSDVIRPESYSILDKIVETAKAKPDWKFGIEGHTDSVAEDGYNQKLSERRAEAVKAYLIKAGVAADRLAAAGFGESRPIADNATEIGRAQNRRVELVRK